MNQDSNNGLRLKFKVINGNATATVADDDDGNKKFCFVGHNMKIDDSSETTTMAKKLLSPPSTSITANNRRNSSSSSSSSAISNFVDCSLSLSSWSLTGRRGRKSTSSTTTTTTTGVTTILSNDLPNTKKSMKIETQSDDEKSQKRKVHSSKADMKKNEVIMKKEYECNVCKKAFSSSRALGGHKSSHYKPNKTNIIPITKETTITTINETQITTSTTTTIGTTTPEPNTTLSLDSSVDDQTNNRKRKMMDIDINELPPVGDEQEDILGPCFLHL